ncbi:hypothetical protein NQ318_022824 [Aromia moschata]|uniref:Peptidase S1 domain-containing protein n=1 Tax=Aromia moschata TaxID=1265417 RepID=A0AAV8XUP9_9CUCU|nr:hypothetical protein NQ318_022824 [Aromia moschata]
MNIPRNIYCLLLVLQGSLGSDAGSLNTRIVGGNTTTIEKHPWQVSLQIFGVHSCGGSIISANTILTAAHCIDEILVNLYQVIIGTTDLSQPALKLSVRESTIHNAFDSETYDYDIAVIKLQENLTFSNQIQPITLVQDGFQVPDGTALVTSGWGITETGGTENSNILREVEINAINWSECYRKLSSVGTFTDRMICAGVSGGGKDTCQGDSGGAVELNGVLIGIVSWGVECGAVDYPGIYTNVSYFRSWIREHTGI